MRLTSHNLNMLKNFKQLETPFRQISTHVKLNQKCHYDSLGISAKATQADIKSAYYKLSMKYHPDKNKESDVAATKFRDISEAYEVLGNVKTRRLYDKGLFIRDVPVYDDIPLNKFYKSRETKSRPPTGYGKTTVYDFDEWSRSHYGATFQASQRFKEKERIRKMREEHLEDGVRTEKVAYVGVLLLIVICLFYEKKFNNADKVTVFGGHVLVPRKSDS